MKEMNSPLPEHGEHQLEGCPWGAWLNAASVVKNGSGATRASDVTNGLNTYPKVGWKMEKMASGGHQSVFWLDFPPGRTDNYR
jgi:hypothetical protein